MNENLFPKIVNKALLKSFVRFIAMFKNKNIEHIFFNISSLGPYSVDLFCKIMNLILGMKLSTDSWNLCGFHTILADITRVL